MSLDAYHFVYDRQCTRLSHRPIASPFLFDLHWSITGCTKPLSIVRYSMEYLGCAQARASSLLIVPTWTLPQYLVSLGVIITHLQTETENGQ